MWSDLSFPWGQFLSALSSKCSGKPDTHADCTSAAFNVIAAIDALAVVGASFPLTCGGQGSEVDYKELILPWCGFFRKHPKNIAKSMMGIANCLRRIETKKDHPSIYGGTQWQSPPIRKNTFMASREESEKNGMRRMERVHCTACETTCGLGCQWMPCISCRNFLGSFFLGCAESTRLNEQKSEIKQQQQEKHAIKMHVYCLNYLSASG